MPVSQREKQKLGEVLQFLLKMLDEEYQFPILHSDGGEGAKAECSLSETTCVLAHTVLLLNSCSELVKSI